MNLVPATLLFILASAALLPLPVLSSPHPQQPAPNDPNASLRQAIELARDHRYPEADNALRGIAPPANPAQRIAFFRLKAAVASGLGHFAIAAEDMETAAKLAPDNQDLRIAAGLARLQERISAHTSPTQTLARLRTEPLPPQPAVEMRLHIAEILSRANLFKQAALDFAAASELAPDRADLSYDAALANFRSGDLAAAATHAQRAKALEDTASIESLLGDIQEKQGRALEAVHSYQAAVNLDPHDERYRVALSLELLRHQTFDAALLVLHQSTELFPKSVHLKILQGLTYYFVDRSADAIHTLLDATQLDNHDEAAAHYLGEITLQDTSSPPTDATAQICRFADEHPLDHLADAYCGGILLRLATDNGVTAQRAEILQRLQHAARIAPKEPTARCQLGKALQWSEKWPAARPEMEACVRLDPGSPDGHFQLARIYRRLGLTQLAERQTLLQKSAAVKQSEESERRTQLIEKFKVLLDR